MRKGPVKAGPEEYLTRDILMAEKVEDEVLETAGISREEMDFFTEEYWTMSPDEAREYASSLSKATNNLNVFGKQMNGQLAYWRDSGGAMAEPGMVKESLEKLEREYRRVEQMLPPGSEVDILPAETVPNSMVGSFSPENTDEDDYEEIRRQEVREAVTCGRESLESAVNVVQSLAETNLLGSEDITYEPLKARIGTV